MKKVIIRFFIFSLQIFAAGSFELQILEISNDKSHLLSGYCCGSSSAINVKHQKTSNCPTCVTSFRLCLKEFQVTNMPKEQIGFFGCAYGNTTTPVLGGSSFVLQEPNIETIKLPFTFRWTVSIVWLRNLMKKVMKRIKCIVIEIDLVIFWFQGSRMKENRNLY